MTDAVAKNYSVYVAKGIAQTGLNMAMLQIRKNSSWKEGFSSLPLMGGNLDVAVAQTTYKGLSVVQVTSVGTVNPGTTQERKDSSVAYISQNLGPAAVRAALTSDHFVELNDGMILDGRDHTSLGVLTNVGGGTLALYTLGGYEQGSGLAGGSSGGIDYVPSTHPNALTIKKNQTPPEGYPNLPDSVMGGVAQGYPPGTLKALAQSGINGSQYVTKTSKLKYPLRGITYVETSEWENNAISGSGILVVHNASSSSVCENLTGSFKGLFIGDEIAHINMDIIGAVYSMKGHEDDIGNGTGSILYSSEVLKGLWSIAGGSGSSGSSVVAVWE